MSDPLLNQIVDQRKRLEDILKKEVDKLPLIEKFSGLAKEMGLDTGDLDKLLDMGKAVFKAAGIKVPKAEEKSS